jgi:hypothetical protein
MRSNNSCALDSRMLYRTAGEVCRNLKEHRLEDAHCTTFFTLITILFIFLMQNICPRLTRMSLGMLFCLTSQEFWVFGRTKRFEYMNIMNRISKRASQSAKKMRQNPKSRHDKRFHDLQLKCEVCFMSWQMRKIKHHSSSKM